MTTSHSAVDVLGAATYISLTSFRRDGTPVATPVWVVPDGDGVAVWTNARTGKVKRIRRDPRVLVAPCGPTGRLRGEPIAAHAEVQPARRADVEEMIKKKYGLPGRLVVMVSERRAPGETVALRITLGTPEKPAAEPADPAPTDGDRDARGNRQQASREEDRQEASREEKAGGETPPD